ncbi:MAG: ADP-ribosylglycohydrolase [Verrucomicrobiales bacterium]|nr:ADP-ribosylglycohydrolase [Verrucomicrobiales bacterium]
MKTLLLLEDNAERIAGFEAVLKDLGDDWQLRLWRDAPTMLRECDSCFEQATLISLDHDLNPQPGTTVDPGTGLQVAKLLAGHLPVCPVIVHSSNPDQSWSMHNELRFAGWKVEKVGPFGDDWIGKSWLSKAREVLAQPQGQKLFHKPSDHAERLQRAFLSLEGLAIADAVGEMLSYRHASAPRIILDGLPAGPWFRTDDSEMALSIVEVLRLYGHINQDALSRRFAYRFELDPDRGYGSMTRMQLREIIAGAGWKETAAAAFNGQGSMGNGGAMRVAPVGAYFADDWERVVSEASASAVVTHTHPEGVAGTIAVALAAAAAWQFRSAPAEERPRRLFEVILQFTPESQVRRGITLAAQTPATIEPESVAKALGNGSLVTAPDTVPFALWSAAHHLDNYVEAISATIKVGGDCDTNAAIVGGIVALSAGEDSIPADWHKERERFPFLELS